MRWCAPFGAQNSLGMRRARRRLAISADPDGRSDAEGTYAVLLHGALRRPDDAERCGARRPTGAVG